MRLSFLITYLLGNVSYMLITSEGWRLNIDKFNELSVSWWEESRVWLSTAFTDWDKMMRKCMADNGGVNPLTPKIWLLILPCSCYTLLCKFVMRTWCLIKIAATTWKVWIFSLPVCWRKYGYCREKIYVNHFWELNG